MPEVRFDPKLVDRLHQDAEVVAEDFAQHFVHHRNVRLRADAASELCLNHVERRFNEPLLSMSSPQVTPTPSPSSTQAQITSPTKFTGVITGVAGITPVK